VSWDNEPGQEEKIISKLTTHNLFLDFRTMLSFAISAWIVFEFAEAKSTRLHFQQCVRACYGVKRYNEVPHWLFVHSATCIARAHARMVLYFYLTFSSLRTTNSSWENETRKGTVFLFFLKRREVEGLALQRKKGEWWFPVLTDTY